MRRITELTVRQARSLKYVLCDIDDTITDNGKLTEAAYSSLWKLSEAGLSVIPVTGRPAGWCDLIVREWPVAAVVGENGAFAQRILNGRVETLTHPNADPCSQEKLKTVWERIKSEIPEARMANDQFCRRYDLALDFAEDEPRFSLMDAKRMIDICRQMGARAKLSSIHVNAWFGDYSKREMTELCMERFFGEKRPETSSIFFGDSPNDEPMFQAFPISCAVSNIKPFIERMEYLPGYITQGAGGSGFAEAAAYILCLISAKA